MSRLGGSPVSETDGDTIAQLLKAIVFDEFAILFAQFQVVGIESTEQVANDFLFFLKKKKENRKSRVATKGLEEGECVKWRNKEMCECRLI